MSVYGRLSAVRTVVAPPPRQLARTFHAAAARVASGLLPASTGVMRESSVVSSLPFLTRLGSRRGGAFRIAIGRRSGWGSITDGGLGPTIALLQRTASESPDLVVERVYEPLRAPAA